MAHVLVTGAAGFIGAATVTALQRDGHSVRATWHRQPPPATSDVEWRRHDLASGSAGLHELLGGVDSVLHLAARAHVTGPARWRAAPFLQVNVEGTRQLAAAARDAGVRRFIYLGSAGVHGSENLVEQGHPRPFRAGDAPHPADAYARSKLEAEVAVQEACREGNMQYTILRAPLVFGAGVAGNFRRLLRHLDRAWPLPAGPRPAPRTLACADILATALSRCISTRDVAGRVLLAGDFDVTVTDLAGRLARLLGRRLRLLHLPEVMLRGRALRSLTMPLLLDCAAYRAFTGTQPAPNLDAALERTVSWYRSQS